MQNKYFEKKLNLLMISEEAKNEAKTEAKIWKFNMNNRLSIIPALFCRSTKKGNDRRNVLIIINEN